MRRRLGTPHPSELADPGGQGERTYLAWHRTGLSFTAVGAALIHVGGRSGQRMSEAIGLFGIAAGILLLYGAIWRYRHSARAARGERSATAPQLVVITALSTTVLGIGALLVVVTGPPP
jgi:putative membrane protein